MSTGPLYAMGGAHPHALERNDAMRGLATGNREGKAVKREQQIHTPECVLDVCRTVWPAGIQLDPCASPELSFAEIEYRECGDELPWFDHVYVNPPYVDLKTWLKKSTEEFDSGRSREQILLFPARPNRRWWCAFMARRCLTTAWLKPLKFRGFAQAFPAPLVLVYTGTNVSAFVEAAAPLACHVGNLGGTKAKPTRIRALPAPDRRQTLLFEQPDPTVRGNIPSNDTSAECA